MDFLNIFFGLTSKIGRWSRLRDACGGGKFWVGRGVFIGKKADIGAWTYIQEYSYIGGGSRIGKYCAIARHVDIGPIHHDYSLLSCHEFPTHRRRFAGVPGNVGAAHRAVKVLRRAPTVVENDVWIGTRATVLRGVRVGTGAVVAAHAVVTKDVPPYAIVAGVPARIVRYRFPEETINALLASRWWLLDPASLDAFDLASPAQSAKEILKHTITMPTDG